MTRFNKKVGAIVLVAVATFYLVASLVTGRSAASEPPPDLSADQQGLDVWKTAALLVRENGNALVVDTRDKKRFDMAHLPGAVNMPGADASDVVEKAANKTSVLVVSETDKTASSLVAEVSHREARLRSFFLKGGIRDWYLAIVLPVPLFSEKPAPSGYCDAVMSIRGWFETREGDREKVLAAIGTLAKAHYEPSLLGSKKKKASGKKKKISGGCGG